MSYRRKKRRRFFLVRGLPHWVCFSGKQLTRLFVVAIMAMSLFWGWRVMLVWNQRGWYGYEPYRVLLLAGEKENSPTTIEVFSIWPDTLKIASLTIPADVVISAVGGYGNYRVSAMAELGRVEGVGNRLLQDSLSYTLGLPIHQVYVSKQSTLKGAWMSIAQQALLGQRSIPEALAIIKVIRAAQLGSVETQVASTKNMLRERMDVDGTMSWYFEPVLTDRYIQNTMRTIWREAALLQVAIVNASGKPFMATSWSRFPRIAGFDVVSVTDQPEMLAETTIVFSDEQTMRSSLGHVLTHLFPRAKTTVGDVGKYRAQTVVILGSDVWMWLTDRLAYLK